MPKQENTAINDLIGGWSARPIEADEPALFDAAPPAARLRPQPFGGNLAPIGAAVAPLPRRRAPAATPPQVPMQSDYADGYDDSMTTVDPRAAQWAQVPSLPQPEPAPYVAPRLPPLPPVHVAPAYAAPAYGAPVHVAAAHPYPQVSAYAQPMRPEYPPPHAPPAYYQAPYADHLDTMRVRALPLEPAQSLGREVLATMRRMWIPFAAIGVVAFGLASYRLLRTDEAADAQPIVMATQPALPVPVAVAVPEPVVAVTETAPAAATVTGSEPATVSGSEPAPGSEPAAAAAVAVAVPGSEPAAAAPAAPSNDLGVPKSSLWQPTRPQPTIAPRVETVAATAPAIEETGAIEIEPAAPVARTGKSSSAKSANKDRSSRRAKRAAAKRAKQVALAELAPVKPVKVNAAKVAAEPRETKVVSIAAAKPMKIGASTVAPAKGVGGPGKLTVASTPSTLIYVDGRNTGMMTPKTLSLPEGTHKITLLSPKDRIAKTISVEIEPGKAQSLSKTFTK